MMSNNAAIVWIVIVSMLCFTWCATDHNATKVKIEQARAGVIVDGK